ncbi:MarR family winged helix-turn-helix transcriptional regulator [Streptomyces xinghaiensis]|uniref:MarR family transcriptional regulator n=2 Tax=Streptomyces TaxID=1883 RepID=A0A3R7IKN5_9ACTN|nr:MULTISPECIES: MarR family winged helix-turn-helix transcriptional regulator [Streptomyces]KNE80736.1 regulatory protein IclR [Streptomyces fradiae]OFA50944.1 transcriptional regulator [Streptomyces fradiae]PQM19507.1 MarR family transcriptional regulator [Streptomyces xinghaiensis]RKM90983.1 MarR family transcriptional regulator [Streptomyces xinghaiensis]RNC68985.1 MarR family transcriptional regulator [Streptomyces xinghaiensis]
MHRLLVLGDQDDAYATNNLQRGGKNTAASDHAWAVTRALAAGAVRAGWTRASFLQVLLDGPYKAGQPARSLQHRRGYDRAAAWLHRAWEGAQQHVQSTDPITTRQDFHAALAAFRTRIERTPWKGSAGKTDLRNLCARMEICARAGSWDHTVSERDLAERMGCSRTTAHTSNQRLLQAKLLRQLDHGSPTEGARWMLISHRSSTGTTSHHRSTPQGPKAGGAMSGPVTRHPTTDPDINSRTAARMMHLDAFAHHGLGGSGLTILAALAERDGQTTAELQGSASISRSTAYRQLGKLKTLGLIHREGELYHLSPNALEGHGTQTPDCADPVAGWPDTAERLSTAGTGEQRRRRHEAQRIHWHHEQARIAQRRHAARQGASPHPAIAHPKYLRADGCAIDPTTGEVIAGLRVASDSCWIWDTER